MKRTILAFIVFSSIFWCAGAGFADGIPGATDKVIGATLIVPFFEVGINSGTHPIDTLLAVTAFSGGIIHYHVWDIDGNAMDLYGNVNLDVDETWSASMRAIINSASSSVKTALTDGNYYRGFVTIDKVTADTILSPVESGYPFSNMNRLEGYIYYVRLDEGSSNSMTMIPLEYVGDEIQDYLRDFYQNADRREEIDGEARACAAAKTRDESCGNHAEIDRIHSRVFLSPAFNASTRIIIFMWDPDEIGGISPYCDSRSCDSEYSYNRYDENGTRVQQDTSFRLDHVVNVIEVSGTENGFVSIWDIPCGTGDWQVYAFSITNAKPSGTSKNWDAILESYINP